jgi:hypothetical protein
MAKKDEAVVTVKADTSQLDQAFDKANNAVKDLGTAGEESIGLLDNVTGGWASSLVKARAGIGSLIAGLNLTKVALIATGIGAFVVAIGSLVAYFAQTKEGAKALEVAVQGLGAVFNVLIERAGKFGSAIVKLFKGDFAGAVDDATAAVSGFGAEVRKEFNAVTELTKATQALRESQRGIVVETAKQRAEIERLKMISDDVNKSIKERITAAKQAAKLEQELVAERVRIAQEEFRIEKEKQAMSYASEEDMMRLAQLEAEVFNIQQESRTLQTELQNKVNGLRAEGIRLAEEEKTKTLEAIAAYREANALTEIELLRAKGQVENDEAKKILAERGLIISEAYKTEEQLEEEARQRRRDTFQMNMEYYSTESAAYVKQSGEILQMGLQVADSLGTLFLKNDEKRARRSFQLQKTLSIVQAIMSTAEGVTAALTDKTMPSTALRIAQAIAVGAMGAAQVATIARQQFQPSSAPSTPSVTMSSATSPMAAPAPGFSLNQDNSGFRAYVLGSEVSNQMQADQRLRDRVALFG